MANISEQEANEKGKQLDRDEKGQFVEGHTITGGRPKNELSLTAMIKRKLKEMKPDGRREAIEVLAENIIQQAMDGHPMFGKLVWNYLDGLPLQNLDLTSGGKEIQPVLVKFINAKPLKFIDAEAENNTDT